MVAKNYHASKKTSEKLLKSLINGVKVIDNNVFLLYYKKAFIRRLTEINQISMGHIPTLSILFMLSFLSVIPKAQKIMSLMKIILPPHPPPLESLSH